MANRKNLLTPHEAIVVALINIDKHTFAATFADIAEYIERKNLFPEREGGVDLATQVMLRSTKSSGRYAYLFEQVSYDTIRLRNGQR